MCISICFCIGASIIYVIIRDRLARQYQNSKEMNNRISFLLKDYEKNLKNHYINKFNAIDKLSSMAIAECLKESSSSFVVDENEDYIEIYKEGKKSDSIFFRGKNKNFEILKMMIHDYLYQMTQKA